MLSSFSQNLVVDPDVLSSGVSQAVLNGQLLFDIPVMQGQLAETMITGGTVV